MRATKIHCAYFFIFALSVAVLFTSLPIVQPVPQHPYSSWYPFKVIDGVNFKTYATAIYEAVCLLTMALLNVSTDVLIYSLIGIVHYQIQLLGLRLTQVGWDKPKSSERNVSGRSEDFKRVIECITLHTEINKFELIIIPFAGSIHLRILFFRFVMDYHRLFNSIIFVQIAQSVIVFSMTTLRLMIVSSGPNP